MIVGLKDCEGWEKMALDGRFCWKCALFFGLTMI